MKHLFKALAAFQQECPVIHKGTEGYGYSYADLAAIKSVIDPLLQKHGMGYTQPINGTQICTTIFHIESGETIEGCADIPQGVSLAKMNEFQVLGTTVADGSMTLGVFSATAGSGPELNFLRSHDGVIIDSSFDAVDVGDTLGSIIWHVDDSADYAGISASIHVLAAVTPAADDTPGTMIFSTTADTADTVT